MSSVLFVTEELSRVKKELIDSNAQHTHALSIIENKDQALRGKDQDIEELQKQLKVHSFTLMIFITNQSAHFKFIFCQIVPSFTQASQQGVGKLSRTIKQLELHGSSELEELRARHQDIEAGYLDVSSVFPSFTVWIYMYMWMWMVTCYLSGEFNSFS